MATNKNAILRYNTLDKCFRNLGRKYAFEDLLEAVNNALYEDNPKTNGIKTRQLREDLKFMRSEAGYGAPIITLSQGREKYYRYEDGSFSINNSPINSTEADQLKSALQMLRRFEGSPGFEWVAELSNLMADKFSLTGDSKSVISYESNIDYSGYQWISVIFNAIVNKQVLSVTYEPFGKDAFSLTFHPYYLKQYNGRWFAYGLNFEKQIDTWNLALDRISGVQNLKDDYVSTDRDWEDFFYDFIGPTKTEGQNPIEVQLLFAESVANYVITKPLHPSQKHELQSDGSLMVRLKLIPNYELETLILGFGDKVEVLVPMNLRQRISRRIFHASKQYNK